MHVEKPIYILGTALSHDGSSCLLKDGKIIVAIEKERITKKKHDGFNDNLTIQYCLDAENITLNDVSVIVQENTANPQLKPEEIIKRSGRIIPDNDGRVVDISHHVAHAYSAIGTSPFEETAVVVMDGQGSSLDTCIDVDNKQVLPNDIKAIAENKHYLYWEKESYYSFNKKKLIPVFKDFSRYLIHDREKYPVAAFDMEHSIAEFYGGISYYIFNDEFCEGKLMGLAPYGNPGRFNFNPFEFKENRVFLKYDWMQEIPAHLSGKYQCFGEYFQYYADLAYFAQKSIEQAIFYLFNCYYQLSPQENVSYAGGLALNAVANAKILSNTPYKNIYIQPAASDNGLAIGCAYYGWLEVLKKEKVRHDGSTYFGKIYKNKINNNRNQCSYNFSKCKNYISKAVSLLADGKIIAWFQEGSEFGPRALGHRSILADPRNPAIRNFINHRIKHREDFRPFAPSILAEEVEEYFEMQQDSPYMLMIAKIQEKWEKSFPGITHKDNTARVQTVHQEISPKFYKLIKQFMEYTGIPMLLNTSFNDRGMPIVETPEDAINMFINSKYIDALFIGEYLFTHKNNFSTNHLNKEISYDTQKVFM